VVGRHRQHPQRRDGPGIRRNTPTWKATSACWRSCENITGGKTFADDRRDIGRGGTKWRAVPERRSNRVAEYAADLVLAVAGHGRLAVLRHRSAAHRRRSKRSRKRGPATLGSPARPMPQLPKRRRNTWIASRAARPASASRWNAPKQRSDSRREKALRSAHPAGAE